ncbi:fibronectin type III domain-containing protein [Luteolibacter sp. GHJ8]|uniref:Fibronectin type III domain-containing protein n=1 Tax=Luteolibacter rhizosphaerae TaxID=2989719 RepID=A0ABT3G5N3_9BACT|nr:fibronectin type III domain-containing protein [Luteolibacter rhizosphaerae]MCW1914789.1 fibronectin type III domain-containing protein [Luteolibacter rhizosphaerae]
MLYFRESETLLRRVVRYAFLLLALGNSAFATTSGSVEVAWNPNREPDVTGYKIYWGESSRQYTSVQDVGNNVSGRVSNLTSGQTYYCAVKAYNSAQQESGFSSEVILTYVPDTPPADNSSRIVLLEAESGTLTSPAAILGGGTDVYVDSTNFATASNGSTTLSFNVDTAANYHVWCRVKAPAASSDSFNVSLNNGTEQVFHVYGVAEPTEPRSSGWIWKRIHVAGGDPRDYPLTAGAHTLKFRVREQGACLDRIVVSSNPDFVPTDSLARSGDVLALTSSPVSMSRTVGQTAFFEVTAAATGPVSYQWKKGNVAISGATGSMLILDQLETGDAGSYTVTLTRGTASVTTVPAVLTVSSSAALPDFKVAKMTMNPDLTVNFDLSGGLNSTVLVYASANLQSWSLISTQVNSTGTIRVSDPGAEGQTKRFYKIVTQ